MSTLVISDIHIGDPRLSSFKRVHKIVETLNKPWDKIILNGDIVDLWIDDDVDSIMSHHIIKTLIQIGNSGTPIDWIIGNHDHGIDNIIGSTAPFNFVDSLSQDGIAFMHGHQLDLGENKWWYAKLGTKWNLWVWKKFDFDIQMWWHTTKNYQGECHADRRKLLKHGFKEEIIVIGHTHRVAHQFIMHGNDVGQEIFDIGSAMELGTYGIVENGKISLHRM